MKSKGWEMNESEVERWWQERAGSQCEKAGS